MTPNDVIWRVLSRLQEDKEIVSDSMTHLHPERHRDLLDALHEIEQLLNTQAHLLNRMRRRYERS